MLRQTSEANCLLGRNWGYDGQGVWVTEGCGGEFGTGSTSRKSEPPQAANTLVPTSEKSEMAKVTTGVNPDVKYTGYFTPYGTLRTIVSIPETGAQIQDNASRMGIDFKTMGPVKVFGTGEWGLNLVQSETSLNPGATTNNNFGVINPTTQPVVGIRLGFFGVDTGKFGRLSFGKQNATHYDIVSYTTDRFNVFGGQSTAAYVAGTDGGESGTGRADQTILYHVKFAKIFDLGAQGQLRTADTSQAFNGFGFSLQAKLTPAVQVGGSFTKTFFSTEKTNLFFNGRGTDYWSLAAKGNWRTLEWGAVWIRQANGDLAFVRNPVVGEPSPIAVGFSASGVELYSKLWLHKTALVGGFEGYFPRDLSLLIRPEFKTRYAILGAEYHFSPSGYTYVEARVGDTKDAEGRGGYNAAAIGFRYDFSWKTPHIQWPAPY
jgi:predicted porin